MTGISPSVRQAIESLGQDRAHGAAWLAREAAGIMARAAREITAETPDQMVSALTAVARPLAAGQPHMAAVGNAVGAVVLAARTAAAAGDVATLRRAAVAEARSIVAGWERNARLIARHAERIVPKGPVLTHSHSATVMAALERLAKRGAPVVVTESLPLGEGRTTARLLADRGFSECLIADAQAGAYMGRAAAVLVGADTIFADGAVVNKVGTLALALLARQQRVPFFVVSESLKVAPNRSNRVMETPSLDTSPDELPTVYFDITPPRLITALITEEGVTGSRELRALVREARRWQRALSA